MDFTRLEARLDTIASNMNTRLDKLDGKIDVLDNRLDSVDRILAVQAEQLATHIKRTELAEENLSILRADLKPVQVHVARVDGVLRFLGLLSILGTLAAAIHQLLRG